MKGRKGTSHFSQTVKPKFIQLALVGLSEALRCEHLPRRAISNFEYKPYYRLIASDCIFVLIKLIIFIILSSRIINGVSVVGCAVAFLQHFWGPSSVRFWDFTYPRREDARLPWRPPGLTNEIDESNVATKPSPLQKSKTRWGPTK